MFLAGIAMGCQLNSKRSRIMIGRSGMLVMLSQYAQQPGLSPKLPWKNR